ncbi:MAG: glycosyltransferase family 2 protein [Desulfobulbaceae bacterium]|nr:glycosyltransferase family 2 protein [Desulfobulbaceae bacterium]
MGGAMPATVSLIITTYNWKEALRLVLLSALRQSRLPDEIIVADDGSRADTAEIVASMIDDSPVAIVHSWQEDKGFRAAMSRNRAIAQATGEYVILIDGDMVLERHFVADHLEAASPGCFVQGSRVLVSESVTGQMLSGVGMTFHPCSRGLGNRKNTVRCWPLSRLFFRRSCSLRGIRTCNFAFWRGDALLVNGFNEDFEGWGREDSEFAARLLHRGVWRRNLKFSAVAYHLFHPLCDRQQLSANDAILERTMRDRLDWCANGIDKYL